VGRIIRGTSIVSHWSYYHWERLKKWREDENKPELDSSLLELSWGFDEKPSGDRLKL